MTFAKLRSLVAGIEPTTRNAPKVTHRSVHPHTHGSFGLVAKIVSGPGVRWWIGSIHASDSYTNTAILSMEVLFRQCCEECVRDRCDDGKTGDVYTTLFEMVGGYGHDVHEHESTRVGRNAHQIGLSGFGVAEAYDRVLVKRSHTCVAVYTSDDRRQETGDAR